MPPIRTTEGGASGRRGKSHGGLVWWIEPNAAERTGRVGSDGHCSLAASRFGSAGFGRRGAGSEGPASPTAAECPGRSRRATEANRDPRPGSGAWSIGPGPPTISFGRTRPLQKKPNFAAGPHHGAAIAAKQRPPVRSSDRSKDGASRQRDRRSIALEAKRGRDRLPIGPRRYHPRHREHHEFPGDAATSSVPVLSGLLCRPTCIWLCAELSLYLGPTRAWAVPVRAIHSSDHHSGIQQIPDPRR